MVPVSDVLFCGPRVQHRVELTCNGVHTNRLCGVVMRVLTPIGQAGPEIRHDFALEQRS
jgi:hypothetical protein